MTNKVLSQLTFLVAFVLLILFGRNLITRYQQQQPNEYQNAIKSIKSDDIVRIELTKASQELVLTRQDGIWRIASKSADIAKVNELIGALLPKQSPQLISENTDKFSDLEATQETGVTVKLITQQDEKVFIVGKAIDTVRAVKYEPLEKVYGISSVPELSIQASDWLNTTVVDIDSSNIKKISVSGKEIYSLIQTGDRQWSFEGSDEKVNSDGVTTYAYKFNPLKADGIASEDQKQSFDLSSAGFRVSITDTSDVNTDLQFKLIDDQYIIKRSTDNEYFILDKPTGESFEKQKSGFVSS